MFIYITLQSVNNFQTMNTELQKILEAYNNKLIELKYQKAISLLNLITDEDYLKLIEDNKDLFEPISQENGDQYLHREDVLDKINETFIQYINNPDPNKMNEDELKQYIESLITKLDEKQLKYIALVIKSTLEI